MDDVITPVDKLIEAKIKALAEAQAAVDKLEIELAQLNQVRAVLPQGGARKKNGKIKRRNRPLSEKWKMILTVISAGGEGGMNAEKIVKICNGSGITINKDTLRSQMSIYVARGLVKSVGHGIYALTPEGHKAAECEPFIVESSPLEEEEDEYADTANQEDMDDLV